MHEAPAGAQSRGAWHSITFPLKRNNQEPGSIISQLSFYANSLLSFVKETFKFSSLLFGLRVCFYSACLKQKFTANIFTRALCSLCFINKLCGSSSGCHLWICCRNWSSFSSSVLESPFLTPLVFLFCQKLSYFFLVKVMKETG